MRKITSFLTVLLMMVLGSTEARAQMPAVSDESNTYLYYIYNARDNGYYVRWTYKTYTENNTTLPALPATATTFLGTNNTEADLAVRPTFKVVSTGTEGQYYLVVTNYNNESTEYYVGCSSTGNGANKVLLYTDENKVNAVWALTYTQNNGQPGITICPNGTTASWNMHGGKGNNVGLYNNDDGGATWLFVPANEAAYNKMTADVNADPIVTTYSTSSEIGKVSQTSTYYTNLVNSAAATYSESNAKVLAVNFAAKEKCLNYLYLPSGYYKMKGMDDTRVQYLYNDYLLEGNSAGYTLIGNTAETNNHIWYVTNNGTTISIKNGQGTAIGRGNQNQGGANGQLTKYSTLSFQPYSDTYFTASGGLSFKEGLDQPNNNDVNSNYYIGSGDAKAYYLTAWADHPEASDCRWTFEAASGDAYNVVITGLVSYIDEVPYVTYNDGQIALNGGFILFTTVPSAEDFSYTSANYDGVYSVNSTSKAVTLALTPKAPVAFAQLKTIATSLLTDYTETQIGYPKAGARATLQSALEVANAVENANATSDDVSTLQTAIATYQSTTDVNLPENGKAYIIKFRKNDKTLRYLYREAGTVNIRTADWTESTEVPNTAIFVCRIKEDAEVYKYSFVPAYSSGYLKFNAISEGYHAQPNCAYIKALCTAAGNGYITDNTLANLFGYLYMTFDGKTSTDGADRAIIISNAGTIDTSGSPFLTANYTSALVFEEVEYPNNVTLNQAVGINEGDQNIATFSAPFATVVPENTAAYVIYQTGTSSVTMEKLADAGAAIPANTGVLLYGSTTSATMLPATSETQAALTGSNKLVSTAGAAVDMTSVANAYILGKPSDADPVAFYACSGGTLAMNKAYLSLADEGASENAAALTIDFGNTTTALQQVATEAAMETPMYDLSGRRVLKVQKGGLYIQNGKKYIVK